MSHTTTHTHDPDAIARACLDAQLLALTEMDEEDIVGTAKARKLALPDTGDEEAWDRISAALARLADQVRAHVGLASDDGEGGH